MVRKAELKDKEHINKLGLTLNPKYDELFKLEEILKEPYSRVYVYQKNDKVIGFIHATVLYETIDIINLVVDSKYRRCRVASNLFDFLLSEAPTSVKLITLEVNENNNAAIKFYENFGFEVISRRKNYYKDADAFLMGRRLH